MQSKAEEEVEAERGTEMGEKKSGDLLTFCQMCAAPPPDEM